MAVSSAKNVLRVKGSCNLFQGFLVLFCFGNTDTEGLYKRREIGRKKYFKRKKFYSTLVEMKIVFTLLILANSAEQQQCPGGGAMRAPEVLARCVKSAEIGANLW